MGWEVESNEPNRLVMRRGWWGFSRDPARLEVVLSEAGQQATTIVLNGHVRWTAGRATRSLEGEMNRFRNAVEVAAHRSPDGR